MKIVVYLIVFCLLIRTEFASKVATNQSFGAHLIKTKSGKFFLSIEKRDSVEKTKKRAKNIPKSAKNSVGEKAGERS